MCFPAKQGLVECRGLDSVVLSEIKVLADLCNQHDGLDLKLNWKTLHRRPVDQLNDFLYYADGQLVGFLPLFCFNSQEGEISGMVHPAYRRRGIFSTLFAAARQEALRRALPSLLLIAEQASPAGQAFARHLTTTYDHGEYKMVLGKPLLPASVNEHLHFRLAQVTEAPILARITADAFHIPHDDVDWYTEQSLTRDDCRYYVGEVDGDIIGKLDVSFTGTSGYIGGFAVVPAYQGRGYGRQMLARAVQAMLAHGQQHIWLEVSIDNEHALSLYQSCGFKATGGYDYYRLFLTSEDQKSPIL